MSEASEKLDMEGLLKVPGFLLFLSRVIQSSGIHTAETNGADGRHLVSEGRRDLGLIILRDAARGQPVDDPGSAFAMTLIQVLREEAQSTAKEPTRGRRTRYDDTGTDDGDGSA